MPWIDTRSGKLTVPGLACPLEVRRTRPERSCDLNGKPRQALSHFRGGFIAIDEFDHNFRRCAFSVLHWSLGSLGQHVQTTRVGELSKGN